MPKELEQLITHLNNLSKTGTKQATFDVNFLLTALGQPIPNAPTNNKQPPAVIGVDGGAFKD